MDIYLFFGRFGLYEFGFYTGGPWEDYVGIASSLCFFARCTLYVIKSAEKIMYSDKENYYRETGKDRRR